MRGNQIVQVVSSWGICLYDCIVGSEEAQEGFNRYRRGQFAVGGSPGQTMENETGIFTIEKAAVPGTVNVGPINIQIKNVRLVSLDVTDEATAGIAGDEVRYLQMDAILDNTTNLPIQFFSLLPRSM